MDPHSKHLGLSEVVRSVSAHPYDPVAVFGYNEIPADGYERSLNVGQIGKR